MTYLKGFTLVELMVVVVIVAILAAIALPSYNQYMRKKDLALAQQEVLRIASELDRHKLRNFSFKNYCPGNTTCEAGSDNTVSTSNSKYTVTVVDGATSGKLTVVNASGLTWRIIATRNNTEQDAQNYDLLMTSDGTRCMTRTTGIITATSTNCGKSSENW